MNQKKLKLVLLISAAVLAVVGIALLVFGCIYDENVFTKVSIIVVSALSILLGGEIVYLLMLMNDVRPNYFLYDNKLKRNISVQKLTFEDIAVRMNRYFSHYASSEGKIWTDKILEDPALDMADEFKPVVAYKLLYDLAEKDIDAGWSCFELASEKTVEFICRALEINNDNDMANTLRAIKKTNPVNTQYLRTFLVKNRKYLKSRMFRYVYDNIRLF